MPTFEEELRRLRKPIRRLSRAGLLFKSIHVRGVENWVRAGANVIVGNHIGSYKDVGTLFLTAPRPIFFTANNEIFRKEDFSALVKRHLHLHLGRFGGFLHLLANPWYSYIVQYISSNIASVGSIPASFFGNKRAAILRCQEYLRAGRAVIALQGRGRVQPRDRNPYVSEFRHGVPYMCLNLHREGLDVPVTPVSFFGTHVMFTVPARVRVNVGPPLYIRDYASSDSEATVERFRAALQRAVEGLLLDSLRWTFEPAPVPAGAAGRT